MVQAEADHKSSNGRIFHSMREVEEHYFPNDVKKHPIIYRRRVTEEEARAMDEWLGITRFVAGTARAIPPRSCGRGPAPQVR